MRTISKPFIGSPLLGFLAKPVRLLLFFAAGLALIQPGRGAVHPPYGWIKFTVVDRYIVVDQACATFDAVPAFGEDADPQGFVTLHCARGKASELADWLLAQGAERVAVVAVEQVFDRRNPLHDALIARIGEGEGS